MFPACAWAMSHDHFGDTAANANQCDLDWVLPLNTTPKIAWHITQVIEVAHKAGAATGSMAIMVVTSNNAATRVTMFSVSIC